MTKQTRNLITNLLPMLASISAVLAPAQTGPTVQQKSESSACSNIVAMAGNVNVDCSNLTLEEKKVLLRIPAILNKIPANQLDPDLVMTKLDEIQTGVSSIKSKLDAKEKQEEDTERIRHTPPLINPFLQPISGKVYLYVKSINLIPYKFHYFIVDSKNVVLGGFPLSDLTVYPSVNDSLNYIVKDIDLNAILDHYIELRFFFQSPSYEELKEPSLAGEIIHKYTISKDGTTLTLIP